MTLGIRESLVPLIWLAAPIAGTFAQPPFGWWSDRHCASGGHRRPFILGGTIGAVVSLFLLSSLSYLSSWNFSTTTTSTGISSQSPMEASIVMIVAATLCVYGISISLIPTAVATRALIIDMCTYDQQSKAGVWIGCAIGIGNLAAYLFTWLGRPPMLQGFECTEFQWLSFVASIGLILPVVASSSIREKRRDQPSSHGGPNQTLRSLLKQTLGQKGGRIRLINEVQLLSSMGWILFRFYMTKFVSQSAEYRATELTTGYGPDWTSATLAGVLFSVVECVVNIICLFVVQDGDKLQRTHQAKVSLRGSFESMWFSSLVVFGCLMFASIFTTHALSRTVLVCLAGIPWPFTVWIPYVLLGKELAREDVEEKSKDGQGIAPTSVGRSHHTSAGFHVGLLNAALSAPHIVSFLVSGLVFWTCDMLGSREGVEWILRWAGLTGLIAAWHSRKLMGTHART